MGIPFNRDIDLRKNEIQNAVVQNLSTAPSSPKAGQIYFNTVDKTLYVYAEDWVDALKQGGTYSAGTGINITNNVISVNLSASDIPNLTLSKITDVTATYEEVNILDGATLTTTELNYVSGVTSAIQTQLDNKLAVKPDGTNNLIDSNNKVSMTYLPDVITGQLLYAGTFVASTAVATLTTNAKTKLGTTSNTITLTNDTTAITGYVANEGCYYICSGDGTFASISFEAGDWLISTGSGWTKIDNTDTVTPSGTQTLTNKTIDADDNTILDLTTSNLKSGVLQTTVRATSSASDTTLATEKAIATALATKTGKIFADNTALTPSGGVATWTISNTLGTDEVMVQIFENSTNVQVMAEVSVTSSNVVIKMNAADTIAADTYRAVIIG